MQEELNDFHHLRLVEVALLDSWNEVCHRLDTERKHLLSLSVVGRLKASETDDLNYHLEED